MSGEVQAHIFPSRERKLSNLRIPKMGCDVVALLTQLERDYLMHSDLLHMLLLREDKRDLRIVKRGEDEKKEP